MEHDLILYQFSRSKVEQCGFSHFLGLYEPDKLPEGRRLREMMNCFVFCIEGWDDDPREIHMIPEVRRFYSAFHEAWPYWLIGGFAGNAVSAGVRGSTIVGGGSSGSANNVAADFGVFGGGYGNVIQADTEYGTVGGREYPWLCRRPAHLDPTPGVPPPHPLPGARRRSEPAGTVRKG